MGSIQAFSSKSIIWMQSSQIKVSIIDLLLSYSWSHYLDVATITVEYWNSQDSNGDIWRLDTKRKSKFREAFGLLLKLFVNENSLRYFDSYSECQDILLQRYVFWSCNSAQHCSPYATLLYRNVTNTNESCSQTNNVWNDEASHIQEK